MAKLPATPEKNRSLSVSAGRASSRRTKLTGLQVQLPTAYSPTLFNKFLFHFVPWNVYIKALAFFFFTKNVTKDLNWGTFLCFYKLVVSSINLAQQWRWRLVFVLISYKKKFMTHGIFELYTSYKLHVFAEDCLYICR